MNTTRRATKGRVPKVPVALLVVAAVLMLGRIIGDVEASPDLPDPTELALRAAGRTPPAEIVDLWAGKVADDPNTAIFRTRLASAELNLASVTGDLTLYERAEADAADAVRLAPVDATARLTHAASLSGQHDFAGALSIANSVLADDPNSVAARLAAGDAQLELGQYDDANSSYRLASLELGSNPPALLSRFARLESIRGSIHESLALSRDALVDSGDIDLAAADAAFYWLQLAHYEFQTGNLDTAQSLLRDALVVDPGNLGATELLANVLAARGDDQAAIALYEELVNQGPAADLHGELAKLYNRIGRPDAAAAEIEVGLDLARKTADRFPAERRHLIGFLADHDPTEALRLATLDLESRQDIYSHAWYAWALLQSGDQSAALKAIEPALIYGTEDPWLLYQAGSIYAANGNVDQAAQFLTEALDLNPHFDVVHAPRAEQLVAERADKRS